MLGNGVIRVIVGQDVLYGKSSKCYCTGGQELMKVTTAGSSQSSARLRNVLKEASCFLWLTPKFLLKIHKQQPGTRTTPHCSMQIQRYVGQLKTAARLAPSAPHIIAHVTVLMREPLHQPAPWTVIPADPSLSGFFSRASASSAEGHHRARTPTPTTSQFPGRRSHHP